MNNINNVLNYILETKEPCTIYHRDHEVYKIENDGMVDWIGAHMLYLKKNEDVSVLWISNIRDIVSPSMRKNLVRLVCGL